MSTVTIHSPIARGQSRTGPQVLITPISAEYAKNVGPLQVQDVPSNWFTKVRQMRKDPTISMVRQLVVAPVLATPWNFVAQKGAPKGADEFIRKQFNEIRTYIVRTTMYGCIDFGFQAFEKVFEVDDDGQVALRKMKALLPDWLDILVNIKTGAFAGIRDWHPHNGWYVQLNPNKCFLHYFDVEGTYWYGKGMMENAESAYDQWVTANNANERYDRKIAGSHWIVHYPIGTSLVNGTEKPNEEIAQDILNRIQSSSGIAVPKKLEPFDVGDSGEPPNAWELELVSDHGATQVAFLDRMAYLDRLKVRALGFPERSILEGKYGTKAEAETHADFAVSNILLRGDDLVRDLNWYGVDQLMELNYGPETKGTVRIVPDAIGADVRRFLRDLYMKMFADPDGFTAEMAKIDRKTLRTALNIPSDVEDTEETDLFEDKLEKIEDGILNQDGLGDPLREGQRGDVGRPGQFRSLGGNNAEDSVGNLRGRREDQRSTTGQRVLNSSDDDVEDSN